MIDIHSWAVRWPAGFFALWMLCMEQQCLGGHLAYMHAMLRQHLTEEPAFKGHTRAVFQHIGVSAMMAAAVFLFWGVL